jgi:adenylylsulfate kinase
MKKNDINDRNVYWLMGPTSSGKSTIAKSFLKSSREKGIPTIHFDGDEVRDFFQSGLGFSEKERLRVVMTLAHLSNKALNSGLNVIVSALTANADARNYIVSNVNKLVIVYIKCDVEICSQRDPKGLYKKAKDGEIKTLIGINGKYHAPKDPDILINTENDSIDVSVSKLITKIKDLTKTPNTKS